MKKSLLLIFILATLSIAVFLPQVHSQASTLRVLNYSHYFDSLGFIVVVGEVQNIGPNTLNTTVLTGVITGSDGTKIDGWTQVWGKYLVPNEKAPFYMEFDHRNGGDGTSLRDIAEVEISVYEAIPMSTYQYPDVRITDSQSYLGTNPGRPATAYQSSDGDWGFSG